MRLLAEVKLLQGEAPVRIDPSLELKGNGIGDARLRVDSDGATRAPLPRTIRLRGFPSQRSNMRSTCARCVFVSAATLPGSCTFPIVKCNGFGCCSLDGDSQGYQPPLTLAIRDSAEASPSASHATNLTGELPVGATD